MFGWLFLQLPITSQYAVQLIDTVGDGLGKLSVRWRYEPSSDLNKVENYQEFCRRNFKKTEIW